MDDSDAAPASVRRGLDDRREGAEARGSGRGGWRRSGRRRDGVVATLMEAEVMRGRGVGVGCSRSCAAGSGSLSCAWAAARDEERETSERSRTERRELDDGTGGRDGIEGEERGFGRVRAGAGWP